MRLGTPKHLLVIAFLWVMWPSVAIGQDVKGNPTIPLPADSLITLLRSLEDPSLAERLQNFFTARTSLIPRFDWTATARYGLDVNGNGRIDMPNSFAYAHNTMLCECQGADCATGEPQFQIVLDATATSFPTSERPSRRERENAARAQSFMALPPGGSAGSPHWRMRLREFVWQLDGRALKVEPLSQHGIYHACVSEGPHQVQLTAIDHFTGASDTVEREVVVTDFLFVTLGDSYASAEGNPEQVLTRAIEVLGYTMAGDMTPYLYAMRQDAAEYISTQLIGVAADDDRIKIVLWGDDGATPPDTATWLFTLPFSYMSISGSYEVAIRNVPPLGQFTQAAREHDRSHRSSFAAASQAALALERSDPRSSVTFINLAQSGATFETGVFGSYNGRELSRFVSTANMAAQLDALRSIVGRRRIDALYISAGGNDVGFANAILGLLLRDKATGRLVDFGDIETGVTTGRWDKVENDPLFFPWFATWSALRGMDRLAESYEELATKLNNYGFDIAEVYISEYPDPTAYRAADGKLYWCAEILAGIVPGFQIDQEEIEWAYNNILVPLNEHVRNAAHVNGWILIDGIPEISDGHGLCAAQPYPPESGAPSHPVADRLSEPIRWFRGARASEALLQDGDMKETTGTMHPNEFGHLAMAMRLLARLPVLR